MSGDQLGSKVMENMEKSLSFGEKGAVGPSFCIKKWFTTAILHCIL